MRRKLAGVVLCVLMMTGGLAGAGSEDIERAKTYFEAGAQAYSVGQFKAAVQAFEQAYNLAPRSAILFSMAQALRKQYFVDNDRANLDRAITLFRRYVTEVPQGGRRGDAVQALSELVPMAAQLDAESGTGSGSGERGAQATRLMISSPTVKASISVDGSPPVAAPYIAEVGAGKHRVKVTAPGYFDDEREVLTVEGQLLAFDVRLREKPAKLRMKVGDGARIYVDGRYHGEAPLSKALELPAGRHVISVIRTGHEGFSQELKLERGKTESLDVDLNYSQQRNVSLVLLGAAGVSLVVSAGFYGQALEREQAAQDVLDQRDKENITAEDLDVYDAARRDRDQLRRAGFVAFSASALLGAAGGLLYYFDTPHAPDVGSDKKPDKKPRGGVRTIAGEPVIGPGMVGFRGTF